MTIYQLLVLICFFFCKNRVFFIVLFGTIQCMSANVKLC